MNKIIQLFRDFYERSDRRFSTKTVFGLGAIGGLISLIYILTFNSISLDPYGIIITMVFLVFTAVSLLLIMAGIWVLTFCEMVIPSLQKKLSVLKNTVIEIKSTIAEAKILKQELTTLNQEINTLKNDVKHIHSTSSCIALQDMMKDIVKNGEKTPSQELRDDIVELKAKVDTLTLLLREKDDRFKNFLGKETLTENNDDNSKTSQQNKFEPQD